MTRILSVLLLIGSMALAFSQARKAQADDPDMKEMMANRLDMGKITTFMKAATALNKAFQANPGLKESIDDAKKGSIAMETKIYESHPPAAAAIKSSGISVRDYVVMTGTFMGAYQAAAMMKGGQLKEKPEFVSAENLAFINQNLEKISDIMGGMGQ